MVILKTSEAAKQGAAKGGADAAPANEAGARADRPSLLVPSATLREVARLAALQTELQLLGELASLQTVQGLQPYIALRAPGLTPATIVRSERDARFQLPSGQIEDVMKHLGAALDKPPGTPSLLIIVAHQDDESIGAGAQLARLEDVTVLHVTDGAPRDAAYAHRFGYASASDYGEARRREATEALKLAGVPEARQLCLGIPDGEAPYHLVELSLTLAELLDEQRPEAVLTHPYEGGHTDHDAIAFAVHLACGILRREGTPTPAVLELTSYHNRNGHRIVHDFLPHDGARGVRTLRLSKQAAELKARMYECFTTQQKCLEQFAVHIERFRPAPRYVFTEPPHPGTLDYERWCRRMTGNEWRAQAERALAQLRIRKHGRVSMTGFHTITSSSADTQFMQQL